MTKRKLSFFLIIAFVMISIFLSSCGGGGGVGGTGIILSSSGKVSNTFGQNLNKDIDGDGDLDAAVVLNGVLYNSPVEEASYSITTDGTYIYITGETQNPFNNLYDAIDTNGNTSASWIDDRVTPNLNNGGLSIAADNNGNFYITGFRGTTGSSVDAFVIKFDTNGGVQTSFGTNGEVIIDIFGDYDYGQSITTDNSRVYVAGYSWNGSNEDAFVVKLNSSNGTFDTTFGSNGKLILQNIAGTNVDEEARSITISNNNIFITGWCHNGNNWDSFVAKISNSGSLDPNFGNNGIVLIKNIAGLNLDDEAEDIEIDNSNGKIYITGGATNSNNNWDAFVVRLNPNGSIDTTFGNNGKVVINDVAGTNVNDDSNSIVLNPLGIYITGSTHNGNNYDAFVIRIDY